MYIYYDETGTDQLVEGYGLTYWLTCNNPNLACNVCVWIVPGTVEE